MDLKQRNKNKRINAIAKEFLCAMVSEPSYWNVHSREIDFREAVGMSINMAKIFVENELKTK